MFAPQASHLSPSIFIPLKDIFSLESSTSYKAFISYPRPEHLSISPWSQDTDDEQQQQNDSTTNSSLKKRSDSNSNNNSNNTTKIFSTGGRPSDEYVRQMMTKTFIDEGRLGNLFRVMSFFPTFYEIYTTTFNQILKSSLGPVSRTWKCYLGILVHMTYCVCCVWSRRKRRRCIICIIENLHEKKRGEMGHDYFFDLMCIVWIRVF